jgi:uncharacterized short protein YbdD (DUF466 family)
MSANLRDAPLRGWCTTRAVGRAGSGGSGVADADVEPRRSQPVSSTDGGVGSAASGETSAAAPAATSAAAPAATSTGGWVARTWASVSWYATGVLGGSKYDGYLSWHARHGDGPPMSEKEYWRHRAAHEDQHPEGRCC